LATEGEIEGTNAELMGYEFEGMLIFSGRNLEKNIC
jgi:hypothetical protein